MISYIIPTRDRPERLNLTLRALGELKGHHPHERGGAEVLIIDNASRHPPTPPAALANGLRVRTIYRAGNEGAASRNVGVELADPTSEWVVMLDDDSHPVDTGFIRRLQRAPADVAAVSADIYLPGLARRESGGLPEVFIGCGVAIRRRVFLELGGYDAAFNYYAEEYDLAARMMRAGYRIAFDPWFRVEHHKVAGGRDVNTIMARLVRNNGWVMQRYAPEEVRREQIREQRRRYHGISEKEGALRGFAEGLAELRRTIGLQTRTPMPRAMFDRFTGLSHAREALGAAHRVRPFSTAMVVDEGKNGWVVRKALAELGVEVVNEWPYRMKPRGMRCSGARAGCQERAIQDEERGSRDAEVLVIGSMSPGPMLDAYERRTLRMPGGPLKRVIAPWVAVMNRPAADAEVLVGGLRRSA
jgi:GT2 family glycosyltransferase